MPDTNQRRRNWALWAGSILTLLALASNFLYFFKIPQGIIPWLNLVLPAIGLFFFIVGLKRAFGQRQVYGGRISGSILTAVSLLLLAVSVFGFVHARDIPASAGAPRVGQKAPEFALNDTSGQPVSLTQLLSAYKEEDSSNYAVRPKAVLLVFYRGYWWPFCVLELRGIQKDLKKFQAAGIRPVAISVDAPEVSRDLCKKGGYTFVFLSDPKAETIRRYDLLHVAGGPGKTDISRPAEFLVDSSGTVRWVNFTEDIRVRARADEMLAAAKALP
jgi:peroxiredoxin